MLRIFYILLDLIKLILLYPLSWLLGFRKKTDFYQLKADCCKGIGWHQMAIEAYKEVLKDSNDPLVHASLGGCYGELEMDQESLEHYRLAYHEDKSPQIAVGLALAEYITGHYAEFHKLYTHLNAHRSGFSPDLDPHIDNLHTLYELSRDEILAGRERAENASTV